MYTMKWNYTFCRTAVVSVLGVLGAMAISSSHVMADSQTTTNPVVQNASTLSSVQQATAPLVLNGMVTNETSSLVGQSTAGLKIEVHRSSDGVKISEGVVSEAGTFTIQIPKQKAGETLQVIAIHLDSTANEQVTVSVSDLTPKVDSITGDSITGTGLQNAKITLLDDNNQTINQGVIDADGHFSLKLATIPSNRMITVSSSVINNGVQEESKTIVQVPTNQQANVPSTQPVQPAQTTQQAPLQATQQSVQPAPASQEQAVDINGLIGTDTTGHSIWTRPYGEASAVYIGPVAAYSGSIVHISASLQSGSVNWYYISVDGKPIGWVDSRAVNTAIPSVTSVDENQLIQQADGNGIWSSPYGLDGATYIAPTNDYAGKDIQLVQKMTVNGVLWYQFRVNGTLIGWLDSRVLSTLTDINAINQNAVMGATGTNGIWTMPYGVQGAKYIDTTDAYAYYDIVLTNSARSGSVQWYKFSLGGKPIGWIDASALDQTGQAKAVSFNVTIGSTYNNGIWSTPYGINGAKYVGSTNDYAFENVQVVKTLQRDNILWYLIQKDGRLVGWIDADKALSDIGEVKEENHPAVIGTSTKGDGIWSVPYGEYGAVFIGLTNEYSYQPITVIRSITKGPILWNKIQLGDKVIGWVDASVYSTATNVSNENRLALLGDTNGNGVWTAPYGENGANYVGTASNYANRPIQLIRSLDKDGVHWFYFEMNNQPIGWIDARAISNATNVQIIDELGHVTNASNHAVWTVPYGLQNAQYVGMASDFAYKNLHLSTVADLNGVTWYQFDYHGRTGWMDGSAIIVGAVYPLLNVPIIQQRDFQNPARDLVAGCEITAVTMMLQYAGAKVDKVQLAYEMPYSDDDPNQGYVGDPFGNGWTIYPPALMNLVRKYAGNAVNLTGQDLESQLIRNHPVVVWMTMHGFSVHAITLTGFDANNIYYNDPWTGEKNAAMSMNDFYSNWSTQDQRAISY